MRYRFGPWVGDQAKDPTWGPLGFQSSQRVGLVLVGTMHQGPSEVAEVSASMKYDANGKKF